MLYKVFFFFISFDPKLIHTICEPGVSLEYSAAVPGLVIPVDSDILFNLSADLCEKRTLVRMRIQRKVIFITTK